MMWNLPRHELKYKIQQLWRDIWGWKPMYWLRCHTFTRYHIIDISGQDDYKWGWIDRDHAMYLACFKLLTEFVELEDPTVGQRTLTDYRGDLPEDEWEKYHAPSVVPQLEREAEVRALYDWWKTGRKQEWDACYAMHDKIRRPFDQMFMVSANGKTSVFVPDERPEHQAWIDEHDRLEAKDEEMLMRLMKIRKSLWT